jgi:hypothetical protein
VEVYPAGTEFQPDGIAGSRFVKNDARPYGSTDAAIVRAISERAEWQCFDSGRGRFHVIEVWIENETMVEVLPPEYAREYLAFTRPDYIKAAMAKAPIAAAR